MSEDCPRGVQLSFGVVGVVGVLGVTGCANRDVPASEPFLVGEPVGVVWRNGDGEAGDSGRRNGELREGGEPYPKGDGLYDVETDCLMKMIMLERHYQEQINDLLPSSSYHVGRGGFVQDRMLVGQGTC